MNYIGSKKRLLPFIKKTIRGVVGEDLSDKVFCDVFSGTGIVARSFHPDVKMIIANDLEKYSYVLNRGYLHGGLCEQDALSYVDHLNSLPLINDGFIFKNYCRGGGTDRNYFSDVNGQRIDTIRRAIQKIAKGSVIQYVLLASLLECADKVANTTSMYNAYLKHLKKTAQKEMFLKLITPVKSDRLDIVTESDCRELIGMPESVCDIMYLDPPYNGRHYGCYYHMLNTICEVKPDFIPSGVTGMRPYARSGWCGKRSVYEEFEYFVENAKTKYIFLSYSNEGLMELDRIRQIMEKYGKYDLTCMDYQRFANFTDMPEQVKEYLHIIEKS